MSLWQFSESSLPTLRYCIEASKLDINKKWVERFGYFQHDLAETVKENDENEAIPIPMSQETNLNNQEPIIESVEISDDIWQEIKDIDPISQFDYLVENCLKHPSLYAMLAEKLSLTTIEKLCNYIFESENNNSTFLEKFYTSFLPVYLKREQTWMSLDVINKAGKFNSVLFKNLLELIIKDTNLSNQVIQQYISALDTKSQLYEELFNSIILFNLSDEVFIHHIYSIHLLYKNCEKMDLRQNYILSKLSNISQQCVNDKNYGRLLLTYLQSQRGFATNFSMVQKVIDIHRSPFKKPCLNMFHELQKVQDQTT